MNHQYLKSKSNKNKSVSPVLGVILMVAITVILAAVIGVFVFDIGSSEDTANAGISNERGTITLLDNGNSDRIIIRNEDGIDIKEMNNVGDTFSQFKEPGEYQILAEKNNQRTLIQTVVITEDETIKTTNTYTKEIIDEDIINIWGTGFYSYIIELELEELGDEEITPTQGEFEFTGGFLGTSYSDTSEELSEEGDTATIEIPQRTDDVFQDLVNSYEFNLGEYNEFGDGEGPSPSSDGEILWYLIDPENEIGDSSEVDEEEISEPFTIELIGCNGTCGSSTLEADSDTGSGEIFYGVVEEGNAEVDMELVLSEFSSSKNGLVFDSFDSDSDSLEEGDEIVLEYSYEPQCEEFEQEGEYEVDIITQGSGFELEGTGSITESVDATEGFISGPCG